MIRNARKVILVVDDCAEIRRMIGRLLRPQFECLEAASLAAANEHLATRAVDTVLLDLVLRDARVEETLAFASAVQGCRVITMSGLTRDAIEASQLPIRTDRHVSKPFTLRELVAHI